MYVIPQILEAEARTIFSRKTSSSPLWIRKKISSLKRIELIYLPFYCFDFHLTGNSGDKKVTISIDGLLGNTAFFVKNDLSCAESTDYPSCSFELALSKARRTANEEYKGLILVQGLRNNRSFSGGKINTFKKIFYPFWVGYLKKGGSYDFMALDAISGEVQGVKMRRVFLKAFRQLS